MKPLKFDKPWWLLDENESKIEVVIFEKVSELAQDQTGRFADNNTYMKLYGKTSTDGMIAKTYAKPTIDATLPNKLKLNIIKSIVDTGQARIAKNRPRVSFLTNNGNRQQRRGAKDLEKFVFGYFLKNKIYKIQPVCFRDAEIADLSAVHTFVKNGEIVSERVFANELLVEDMDSYYGTPSVMYRHRWFPKWALKEEFKNEENASEFNNCIDFAVSDFNQLGFSKQTMGDMKQDYVLVIEAWKLPNGDQPGKYVRAISTKVLESKEWMRSYFPFVFHRWTEPVVGFYGESLTANLVDTQVEVNRILRDIQTRLYLGTPKIFVQTGTKFVKNHWTNEFGAMIEYAGNVPPELKVFQTLHPELINMLNWQIEQAYAKAGMNEMFSQGQLPAGVQAAVAMRELDDQETARFAIQSQFYEESFVELSQHYIDCARELYEEHDVDSKVKAPSKNFMESLKWSEIDLQNDTFIIQRFPASILPQRPEGRLSKVQEMIEAGFIDREHALELLDLPDTEHWVKRELSGVQAIERRIEAILDKGKYQRPTPFLDLNAAINMATEELNLAEDQDFTNKEERLDLLRRFIQECKTMVAPATPNPAQGMPVGGIPGMQVPPQNTQQTPL